MQSDAIRHADGLPGSLRHPEAVVRRRAMLGGSHMIALNAYALRLAGRSRGFVPDFDPPDGGAAARLLFLFDKPGPGSCPPTGSGFASRDNDDPGAISVRAAMDTAGVPREGTIIWNTVPWQNGAAACTEADLRDGAGELLSLVRILPRLRGVVLVSAGAQAYGGPILEGIGLHLFRSVHSPALTDDGPRSCERRERTSEFWREAWLKVA